MNTMWVQGQVEQHPTVPYWQRVGAMYDQMQGLCDGYNSVAPSDRQLSFVRSCDSVSLTLSLSHTHTLSLALSLSCSLALSLSVRVFVWLSGE